MSDAAAPPSRLYGLDALRGLAVLLMIEQHMGIWLWKGPGRGESVFDYPALFAFNALGGGAAPLFVTLAGIGSALMIAKRARRSESVDSTLIRRGLTLMGFGLVLNFLTPSWFTWRSWFVLHLMGFGMLIAPLLRRVPSRVLLLLAAGVLLATPAVQIAWGTPLDLSNMRMSGVLSRRGAQIVYSSWAPLRIALAEGQFPIFGWLSFYLMGLFAGRSIAESRRGAPIKAGIVLIAAGLIAVGVGSASSFEAGSYLHRLTRLHVPFFPASPALLALLCGGVLIAVGLVLGRPEGSSLHASHPMVTLGRASLSLLLLHVYLFRELSRPLGLWRGLDAPAAMATLMGFTLFAFVAAWLWQRVDYRFGAEWLLRKLAP